MFWVNGNDGVEGLDYLQAYLDQKIMSYLRYPRILLAEDDEEMRGLLALLLLEDGYEIVEASDGRQLLDALSPTLHEGVRRDIDLIISDVRMPGVDGVEVLRRLQRIGGIPPVILITAFGDERIHSQAREFGALAVFDKPFDFDEFRAFIHNAVPPRRNAKHVEARETEDEAVDEDDE
jgi:DNA-binding response OmpR family regulator